MPRNRAQKPRLERSPYADDLLAGVPEIAEYIGRPERQVRWLIEKRQIPTFKLSEAPRGWIYASKAAIDECLRGLQQAALDAVR